MDPASIAFLVGALMSAYGTYEHYQGNQKVLSRQHDLATAESARQRSFDDQRAADIAAHQAQASREGQDTSQKSIAQNVEQYLTPQTRPVPTADYQAAAGEPQEIKDRRDAALAGALDKGQSYAKKLAALSSLKMLNFNNATSMNRLGEKIGNLNSAAIRSSEILPMEMQGSQLAARGNNTRADIANGIGSIAMMYGLTAAPAATTAASGMGGGTGITIPADAGYARQFPGPTGIDPTKTSGVGLKVPRLVY